MDYVNQLLNGTTKSDLQDNLKQLFYFKLKWHTFLSKNYFLHKYFLFSVAMRNTN